MSNTVLYVPRENASRFDSLVHAGCGTELGQFCSRFCRHCWNPPGAHKNNDVELYLQTTCLTHSHHNFDHGVSSVLVDADDG